MGMLERYVADGLIAREGVIVIATPRHRDMLWRRLEARGIDVETAAKQGRYIARDAADTLATFMVDGWPDVDDFSTLVRDLVRRARGDGRRVRAFGEMVVLLWARRDLEATVRLERLWHTLCAEEQFTLLCAYPRSGLTTDDAATIKKIVAAHARLVRA